MSLIPQYGLGPLPWSEETLERAVWQDFKKAHELVRGHPGCDLDERTKSLKAVLRIFNKSAQCFFKRLENFHVEAHDGDIFHRKRQADLNEFEAGFQEELYVFASSAMTLVDQSRALNKKIRLPGYQEKIKVLFEANPRHKFIQELRNDLIHVTLHQPGWQITTNFRDRKTTSRFILQPDQLSRSANYNSIARSYVHENPGGIDLGELIKSYGREVNDFHGWLKRVIDAVAGERISDYTRCFKLIKAVSSRATWNIIFRQVIIPNSKDPYQYLDRYLTPDELDEVQKMPFNSKAQVDRIISMVDEFDACDSGLRAVIYKAFRVKDK